MKKFSLTPYWCIVARGTRVLEQGIYKTQMDAAVRVSQLVGTKVYAEPELSLERVFVSRRGIS